MPQFRNTTAQKGNTMGDTGVSRVSLGPLSTAHPSTAGWGIAPSTLPEWQLGLSMGCRTVQWDPGQKGPLQASTG
eukprot:scaffold656_cov403-Pavlova_lutheri.AAC.53